MTWKVVTGDDAWADLQSLGADQRARVLEEIATWVEDGPPRLNVRILRGVRLYEDHIPSGVRVTYFVEQDLPYVAILGLAAQ